jgi:hypothetical protein
MATMTHKISSSKHEHAAITSNSDAPTNKNNTPSMDPQLTLSKFSNLAYNAYRNISFSPERRRDSTIASYSEELDSDLANMPESERERYKAKYESLFSNWLSAKSRCASSMITGPANFPVRRMDKANRSEENRYKEFIDWREKVLKYIEKRKEDSKPEYQKQNEKFDRLKKDIISSSATIIAIDNGTERRYNRALFVSSIVNKIKIVAKNGETDLLKLSLDLIKEINSTVKKPVISASNAIWKLECEAEAVREQKADNEVRRSDEKEINGVRIVDNFQDDRVQIFFKGKPEQDMINKLKKNAWRWSPFNKCWQRKLTKQAQYDAQNLLK